MFRKVLILSLFFIYEHLNAGNLAKEIHIQSEYISGSPIVGTGFLFSMNYNGQNHFYIATASHVSQGENLKIRINNTDVKLKTKTSRISDNYADIEILEIDNSEEFTPLARVFQDELGHNFLKVNILKLPNQRNIYFRDTFEKLNVFYVGNSFDVQNQRPFQIPSFIVLPSETFYGSSENQRVLSLATTRPMDLISVSAYGETLFTPTSGHIAPGMSGSPLIQSSRVNGIVIQSVEGISTQFELFGAKSFFASAQVLFDLLQKLLNSQEGRVNEVRWQQKSVFLFREFCIYLKGVCQRSHEVVPAEGPAGGGVRGDGGFNLKNSQFTTMLEDISAPMNINGKDILAFKLIPKNGGNSFYIEANLAGIDFIQKKQNEFKIEFVEKVFSAIDIFLQHFKRDHPGPFKFPFIIGSKYFPSSKIVVFADHIEFQLFGALITSMNKGQPLERDLIRFQLDARGHLIENGVTSKHYQPIIKVIGSLSHRAYFVDIRQAFFLDLSEIPKEDLFFSKTFNLEHEGLTMDDLIKEVYFRGPLFYYRHREDATRIGISQFHYYERGFLNFLLDPILDIIDPITEN